MRLGTLGRVRKAPLLLAAALAGLAVAAEVGSAQSSPLTGKVWVLTTLAGKAPIPGTALTSEFTPAGHVSGTAGCNHYSGTFTASGRTLRISSLVSTQMACTSAELNVQEQAFLKTLAAVRGYAVSGTKLTLRGVGGRALLTYGAQSQQLAGTSWNVTAYNNGKQAVVSVLAGPKLTAVFGKDGSLTGFAGCNTYDAPYTATPPKLSVGAIASTRKACATPSGVMAQETQYLAALKTASTYRIEGALLELRTAKGALAVELQRR